MKITIVCMDNDGYHDFIPLKLKKMNIEVTYINLYNSRYKYPNTFYKIFNFFSKYLFNYNLKRVHIEKHLLEKLDKAGFQDHILITRADLFNVSTIVKIKQYTKNLLANFNDHIDKFPRIKKVAPYFDKVFSFEKRDIEKYGYNFITNFIYIEEPMIKDLNVKLKYEVFNVSRLGRRREHFLEKIAKVLNQLHVSNRIIVVGNIKPRKNRINNLEFSSIYIPINEVQDLIMNSNVMLDVCRDDQSGLSFRIFESMMYRKKLITNNNDVINYDFYNPNNILIVNKDASNITKGFFETEYQEIEKDIYNKYTLDSWLKKVFELT